MQARNYIINMNSVTMESYTDGKNTPYLAYVKVVDYDVPIFSGLTLRNLMIDSTLRLDEQLDHPEISEYERASMGFIDTTIYILKTSFTMNNIDLWRDIQTDKLLSTSFIR